MNWYPAPHALIDLIEAEIGAITTEVFIARLPFYEDGYLIEALTARTLDRLVLGGMEGLKLVHLSGPPDQISTANRIGGLRLGRRNVGDYLKFFCRHLAGPSGAPFLVVEDAKAFRLQSGHRLRDMRVRVRHQEEDGSFRAGAYHFFDDQLHRVSMRVHLDGTVSMLKALDLGAVIASVH